MSAKQSNCSLHEILQTPCGSLRDKENHVVLSVCNEDSSAHLLSCHLSKCCDVTEAELIMARAGICGMSATQITRITISPKNLDENKIEEFSMLRNIQFEEKGIRVWRSYRVGRGEEVPFDKLVSLSQGNTVLAFVYHQNGNVLAKSWSSVRRAVKSAHKFYSICFYIDISTFELS